MNDILPQPDYIRQSAEIGLFHVNRMILSPRQWEGCRLPVVLKWNALKFRPENKPRVPDDFGGVYSFVVQPRIANHPKCSYLLYVGQTEKRNFRRRYEEYLRDRNPERSRRPHVTDMLLKWDGYLWFCYARIDQRELITQIEDALIEAYLPPTNKSFPARIRKAVKAFFGT